MDDQNHPRAGSGRSPKVSIIGAGRVGASLAYALVIERLAGEIVLVDVAKDRALGEVRDLQHALPFTAPTRLTAGEYADCAGSDIIVVTAGAAQKLGESRLELAERNVRIYAELVGQLKNVAGDAIIVVVSNPVDVLTYATLTFSGLPPARVIGSGTILDTARFRYELGAHCNIDPRNVHAYIIGEHGDTEVPVWSLTNLAGVLLRDYCVMCGRACAPGELDAIFERVKNAAYDIIHLKGATYYAIALGTARMIEAILRDQHSVVTASTLLTGQYGLHDVCLSLPVVLCREGIGQVIELPLSSEERDALHRSANVLREAVARAHAVA